MGTIFRKRGPTPTSSVRDWGQGMVGGIGGTDPYSGGTYGNMSGPSGTAADAVDAATLQSQLDIPWYTPDQGLPSMVNPPTSPYGVNGEPTVVGSASRRRPGESYGFDPSSLFSDLARLNGPITDKDIVDEEAMQALDRKEQELQQAMLDGDLAKANRLINEIAAAREYMKRAYQDYRNTVNPVYNSAIENSSLIQDRNTGALSEIALAEQGGIREAFGQASQDIAGEAEKIGADVVAATAAQGIANELTGLYLETSEGRQGDAQKILQALETAAYESARAFKAEDLWNIENRERVDLAERDKNLRDAEEARGDLMYRQQQIDIDKAKIEIAHEQTLRRLREGRTTYVDSIGFGVLGAEKYLNNQFRIAGTPLDRQEKLKYIFETARNLGITSSADLAQWLRQREEGSDVTRAESIFNPAGLDNGGMYQEEYDMLVRAMDAYVASRSQYEALGTMNDSGTVSYGNVTEQLLDWKRTQENGRIPPSSLVKVPSPNGVNVQLAPVAASAWQEMVAAAAADGVTLTPGGSYRTYETQVQLAEEKGLYSQGGLAATPGKSNHGLGLAVDMHGITPAQSAWLQANGYKFGWKTISREPWHWEFYGGSTYNETH